MSNSVYKGIALITTAVTKSPTESNPDRVTFSALPAGRHKHSNPQTNPSQAVFVHDIYDTTDDTLAATSLTIEQVQLIINSTSRNKNEADLSQESQRQVLFTVHGYNGHPKGYLLWINSIMNRFEKFYLLPVIWPSMGKTLGYFEDKVYSKLAGELLSTIQVPTGELLISILINVQVCR